MKKIALLLFLVSCKTKPATQPVRLVGDQNNPVYSSVTVNGAPALGGGSGCVTLSGGGALCGDNIGGVTLNGIELASLPDGGGAYFPGNLSVDGGGSFANAVIAPQFLYGTANAPVDIQAIASFDSLVPSAITAVDWYVTCPTGNRWEWQPGAAVSPDNYHDAVDMNPLGKTTSLYAAHGFSVPGSVHTVSFNVTMQAGTLNTGTVSVGYLTDSTCAADLSHISATLDGGFNTYSATLPTDGGLNYYTMMTGNQPGFGSSSTADPVISSVQVKPLGGTGFWASDFWRVEASPVTMWYNTRNSYFTGGTFRHSPGAEMVFDTDATSMAIEDDATDGSTGALHAIGVFVNGRLFTTINPTAGADVGEFNVVTLPPGLKRVEILAGQFSQNGNGPDNSTGVFLRAVYFPTAATTKWIPPQTGGRTLVLYGDSITMGSAASPPTVNGWSQIMRRWATAGSVYIEAMSGRSLFADIGADGGTMGQLTDLIGRAVPTDIWVMIGFNDFAHNTYSSNTVFGTAYASMLDAVHAQIPQARIFSTLLMTGEENVDAGSGSPILFRAAIATACQARAWCNYVDGTTLLAAGDISGDNVHPFAGAAAKLAAAVNAQLIAPASSTGYAGGDFSTAPTITTFPVAPVAFFDGGIATGNFVTVEGWISTLGSASEFYHDGGTGGGAVFASTPGCNCTCAIGATAAQVKCIATTQAVTITDQVAGCTTAWYTCNGPR